MSAKLTSQVSATLGIDNLTSRDYSEPFGYQPSLQAMRAGIRVSYQTTEAKPRTHESPMHLVISCFRGQVVIRNARSD